MIDVYQNGYFESLDKLRYKWDNVQQIIEERTIILENCTEDETSLEDWLYGYLDFVALNSQQIKKMVDKRRDNVVDGHLAKGLSSQLFL